jgi:hypothetical protein
VPLTPGRSIAVDRLHEYGTPFFIEANLPIESVKPVPLFHRLMIAQDTGSAIVGPARADLYWGAGDEAGRIAGRIHHPGRFVLLLPRELDMVAAGREMPLPVPKPNIPEIEVRKPDRNGKTAPAIAAGSHVPPPAAEAKVADMEARKQSGKGKTVSAGAGSATDGRHIPVSTAKAKISEREAGTRDAKGHQVGRQQGHPEGRHAGKANPASSGDIAAGRQQPLAVPKPQTRAIAVRSLTARHARSESRPANNY